MKFPRSNRMLPARMDIAPFAGVFFLVLIFVALGRNLVFTPGVPIQLPEAVDLSGTSSPTVVVAVDASGQLYFANQVTTENALRNALAEEVRRSTAPLTLVIHADKKVTQERLVRLGLLAREVGIKDALLATRPPVSESLRLRP